MNFAKPKLAHVAERAGVSTATASQVLRGTGRISEKTRKKVLQAAKELHYVTDGRAASMRSRRNVEIGFVINQMSNPFNAEVVSGVSDLLESEGYLISVLDARDDAERQGRHLKSFIRNGRGGLLWVPAANTPTETFDLLSTHNIPTVTFMRRPKVGLFDHVGVRNTEALRVATSHLADLGHFNIAYLGGTDLSDVRRERTAGYRQILAERNLCKPVIWDSDDNKFSALSAMTALMETHPEVTGVVCNGDMVALGGCLALARIGKTPGKDISIVGFDDIQDAAVATPPLTTMAVSPYQLGKRLARVLLDRINEPDMQRVASEITAELLIRASTDAPKTMAT